MTQRSFLIKTARRCLGNAFLPFTADQISAYNIAIFLPFIQVKYIISQKLNST